MGPKKSSQENAQASRRLRGADSLRRKVLQKNLQNTILADEALPPVAQVLPGWFCSSCTWPHHGVYQGFQTPVSVPATTAACSVNTLPG